MCASAKRNVGILSHRLRDTLFAQLCCSTSSAGVHQRHDWSPLRAQRARCRAANFVVFLYNRELRRHQPPDRMHAFAATASESDQLSSHRLL